VNKTAKYIFIAIGVILAAYILWYFRSIVVYIIISLILSLMGRPLVDIMGKIKIGRIRIKIPKSPRALLTLLILWILFFSFFKVFIPLIVQEANTLSALDIQRLLDTLEDPIKKTEDLISSFMVSSGNMIALEDFLTEKIMSVFNISFFSSIFGSIASLLGNIFIAVFAISFITFFFLRDEKMFAEAILLLVPNKHVEAFRRAIFSIRGLLMRYFIGIVAQISGIIILVTIGLTIIGVGFRHSLLIGLVAGLMNIIPYLGPIIGASIGVILGIVTHMHLDFYQELLPLAGYMIIVFIIVQVIDNILFQPLIYSSSVHAHPLEIFLVILIGGNLAGIFGMIVAIPLYTIIRVFAKEFFNQFTVVKKLTQNID